MFEQNVWQSDPSGIQDEPKQNLFDRDGYEKLICSFCSKYLSVPPIFISVDGKTNKCGRCAESQTVEGTLVRNETYENLAKNMPFPCSESKKCTEVIVWGEVRDHEHNCPFRQIICPNLNCSQMYYLSNILEHFQNFHSVFSGNSIQFSILSKTNDDIEVTLIDNNNSYFLACFQMDKYFVRFNVFKLSPLPDDYKFSINFSTEHGFIKHSSPNKIGTYPSYPVNDNLATNILTSIQKAPLHKYPVVDDPNLVITVKLKISQVIVPSRLQQSDKFEKSPEEISETMRCAECKLTMSSAIYFCPINHTICEKCKMRSKICPICFARRAEGRNYVLEALYQKCIKIHPPSQIS